MAFNAFTLTRLPQIQDQHFEFFPLALMALDRVLAEPRVKYSLQLAGWFVLQALTCSYLFVFTSISLVVATIARPEPGPALGFARSRRSSCWRPGSRAIAVRAVPDALPRGQSEGRG